jgi:DNA topoisomerase I
MSQGTAVVEFTPEDLARLAQLKYISDDEPGIRRELNGKGFIYFNGHGRPLRDKRQLARIQTLAIPPAWTDVWICRYPDGHLQATGHDIRARKQYIYHERWRAMSSAAKFWRLRLVPKFLPALRRQISRDLRGNELSATRVLAGMIALLDITSIRIGNEEYVRANHSYGLATLRNRHVQIARGKALLRFRAKAGLLRETEITDKRLVRLLAQLKKLRGEHVFQYRDEARQIREIDSIMVNSYLNERTGHHFTAKDFRTWKGSSLAAGILYDERNIEKVALRKRVIKKAIAAVSDALGNTPTVCRKYYIHAGLFDAYLGGDFAAMFARFRPTRARALSRDEQIFARFLRRT